MTCKSLFSCFKLALSLPPSLPPSPTYVDVHQELDGGLLLHAELGQEAWREGR